MNNLDARKDRAKVQEKEKWLQVVSQAKAGSLEEAVARDKLIRLQVVPDDPIDEANDDYWGQFR